MSKIKVYSRNHSLISWLLPDYEIVNTISSADIVMLPGGSDWNPKLYNHSKHVTTGYNDRIDEEQMSIIKEAIKHDVFMIGICRGAQGLTIAAGGVLIQNVTNHGNDHSIYLKSRFLANQSVKVLCNSYHHQMCFPYVLKKDKFEIVAYSRNVSGKYEFGPEENERYNHMIADSFKEPEIIWYPEIGGYAIQAHPEFTKTNDVLYESWLNLLKLDIIEKYNQHYSKTFGYHGTNYFFLCDENSPKIAEGMKLLGFSDKTIENYTKHETV